LALCGRAPFNWNVRSRIKTTVQINATVLTSLIAVAYALLTAASALLFKREQSAASTMILIGFATLFLDQLILFVSYFRIHANFRTKSGDTLFLIYHRANSRFIFMLGLWASALGLLRYVLSH
jgi:hypothetical protein